MRKRGRVSSAEIGVTPVRIQRQGAARAARRADCARAQAME